MAVDNREYLWNKDTDGMVAALAEKRLRLESETVQRLDNPYEQIGVKGRQAGSPQTVLRLADYR
jgi:hypothetical protein